MDLLAPLFKTSLSINNLLQDSTIQINSDTSLTLVYETSIFDINSNSIYQIPDTVFSDKLAIPFNATISPGIPFITQAEDVTLSLEDGVELSYAEIESGFIEIEISSAIKERTILTYTIFSATNQNGDTLVIQELIPAATATTNSYFKKKYDVSGYRLDLRGSTTKHNTLVVKAQTMVDPTASAVFVSTSDTVTINNKIIGLIPSYVKGYFGTQKMHFGPEVINFNPFSKIIAGTIDIDQVDVNLNFKNGIGIDGRVTINQLQTLNTIQTTNTNLTHASIGAPLNINRATETNITPEVNYVNNIVAINTGNSNVDQLLEILPNQLLYDIDVNINPLGNISGGNDFLFKKHPLSIMLDVRLPLSLVANNLTLADTVDLSLASQENASEINGGNLFLYAENGFPFDATVNLELYDANLNYIDKLTVLNKIESAPVNTALRVTSVRSSKITIPLSSTDIDNLYAAKKVILKIAFTTIAQPQFVKIYSGYAIDIKLVGDFTYNVSLN